MDRVYLWRCVIPTTATARSIKSLRLNLEAAAEGKTWLLLPEGFRDQDSGKSYPLPTKEVDLRRLALIPIPPHKLDSGCRYLRRALEKFQQVRLQKQSAFLDATHREQKVIKAQDNFDQILRKTYREVREAVSEVKEEVERAKATLNDLLELGKRGMEAQMRAHLDDKEYQGEKISPRAFRECFRMVTQAVKSFGIPSNSKPEAMEAIMEETAQALRSTQDALSLSPGSKDPETVN